MTALVQNCGCLCGTRGAGSKRCGTCLARDALNSAAHALETWHANGRNGARPPGRLRPHQPERLGRYTRLWAVPAYRMVYDPDGRSYRARLKSRW